MSWIYIILTILIWGAGAIIEKHALQYNDPLVLAGIMPALGFLVGIPFLVYVWTHYQVNLSSAALIPTLMVAVFLIYGSVFFYLALQAQPVSLVISLTSVYPVVTILLGFIFFRESFTWVQSIGLLLVLGGMYLISH